MNIAIMRAFIQMRRMISSYKIFERKINELENKYDKNFSVVFETLKTADQAIIRTKKAYWV